MFQKPHGWCAVLAVLLLPSMAKGAEVEIGHLVARTPVDQTVADGKRITVTLHADAECSGPTVRTVVIQLKDAAIHDVMRERPMTWMETAERLPPRQLWHRAGLGTVHTTAAELREQMVLAGADRAKPPGAAATPAP